MRFSLLALLTAVWFLISCGAPQNRTPALAQAYVGPSTLTLHQDVNPKSPVSATVHHAEPLDIVEYKRRFIKVRTAGGIEGWTDTRQLLSPDQMTDLQRMAQQSAKFPSQGIAVTSEVVNLHTDPSRTSPSFLQVPEGGKLDVIGHKVTPRTQPLARVSLPPIKPRAPRRRAKGHSGASRIPPPPMPAAPRPPSNWQSLSKTHLPSEPDLAVNPVPKPNAPPAPPVPQDDWTLVRASDGKVGWVLSRMLNMAIPDEVGQYAEGHRITSYFAMGNVPDEGQIKHNWLWTTIRKGGLPYDFDNFRFFIWSLRHHRYETVYIEREVIGHYPVEVNTSGPNPAFWLILEDDNRNLWRKKYVFNGYRVNKVDTAPYNAPDKQSAPAVVALENKPAPAHPQSWYATMKQKLSGLLHR